MRVQPVVIAEITSIGVKVNNAQVSLSMVNCIMLILCRYFIFIFAETNVTIGCQNVYHVLFILRRQNCATNVSIIFAENKMGI